MSKGLTVFLFLIPFVLLFRNMSPEEAILFLFAALIHESGHLIMIFLFGYRAGKIFFSPAGLGIGLDTDFIPYRKEIMIFLAGPLAGLFTAIGTIFFLRFAFSPLLLYFFFCNTFLCVLNLFPIAGLDGYQALRSFLCLFFQPDTANGFLSFFSYTFLCILFLFGCTVFFSSQNASLFIFCLMLLWEGERKKATNIS